MAKVSTYTELTAGQLNNTADYFSVSDAGAASKKINLASMVYAYTDLGTATPSTILFADMTTIPHTWCANHSSDQTVTFAAPVAADVGKHFTISKNGTGAGKVIMDLPLGVYAVASGQTTSDGGTVSLAGSAYGSMTWRVNSATVIQLVCGDGSLTFA
jgi:hypothetical protein